MNLLPYRVASQVPEFVRADHPAFLEFLKSYYTWMETEISIGKLGDLVDIDQTVDAFLQYFKKELDINGVLTNINNRQYLKHIKELYNAKGSEEGFEFLFKILFNKGSTVVHPWDYTFKPSEGKWRQDVTVLVSITTGNISNFIGNPVEMTDTTGRKYRTFVINATTRPDGIVEMYISRFTHQQELIAISNLTETATGVVLTTTVSAKVEKSGSGFQLGQLFMIDSYGGSGTLIKVKAVTPAGGITAVDIITFGVGYTTDFNILITPSDYIDPSELGSRIQLGGLTYDSNDDIRVQRERGVIVRHDYTSLPNTYFTDPTYVGDVLAEIKSHPNVNFEFNNYASIKFTVGHLCIYPGYYDSSNNILGDLVYVQDSFYYQAFSYVTALEESLDKYATILKKVLHPAGTKHFGEYLVFNDINVNLTVAPSLNFIVKADAIREFMNWVDQIINLFTKVIANTDSVVTLSDLYSRIVQYYRTFNENSTIGDGISKFDVSIVKLDEAITSEVVSKDVNKPLTTISTVVTDAFSSITDFIRSTTDTSTITDNSVREPRPVYTDTTTFSDIFDRIVDFKRTFTESTVTSEVVSKDFVTSLTTISTAVTDVFSSSTNFIRSTADTATISDISSIQPRPVYTDTFSFSDSNIIIGLGYDVNPDQMVISEQSVLTTDKSAVPDNVSVVDATAVLQPTKYITDTVVSTMSGEIRSEPYYVVYDYPGYWQAGYLENELTFTN